MMGLTQRQADVLAFLRAYRDEHKVMPSCREIAAGAGVKSIGRVNELLHGLTQRGYIRRLNRKARAIELLEPETMQAVLLNKEIFGLLRSYAASQHIGLDTAANALLRDSLGAA
jgi:SOS-response transcriptional repressor LexA